MRPMNFSQRTPRCCLVNVTTGEAIECRFNPSELVEKVAVNWNRLCVPGLSHQVLQFQSSGNRELSGVEFSTQRFAVDGSPLVVTATATFEEILDLRVTSEQRRGPL